MLKPEPTGLHVRPMNRGAQFDRSPAEDQRDLEVTLLPLNAPFKERRALLLRIWPELFRVEPPRFTSGSRFMAGFEAFLEDWTVDPRSRGADLYAREPHHVQAMLMSFGSPTDGVTIPLNKQKSVQNPRSFLHSLLQKCNALWSECHTKEDWQWGLHIAETYWIGPWAVASY